ncbi:MULTISPECIES: hypothetical protein [Rhodococcus]|nr:MULTISPECIES: hypothetical protein [Rhodococcus]
MTATGRKRDEHGNTVVQSAHVDLPDTSRLRVPQLLSLLPLGGT